MGPNPPREEKGRPEGESDSIIFKADKGETKEESRDRRESREIQWEKKNDKTATKKTGDANKKSTDGAKIPWLESCREIEKQFRQIMMNFVQMK